jgi:hypothetical protein
MYKHKGVEMKVLYKWCGYAKAGEWVGNTREDGDNRVWFLIDDPYYPELITSIEILPYDSLLEKTEWGHALAYTYQKACLMKQKK